MVALMHWKGCHIFKNCLLKRCSKVGRDFPLQLLLQVWLSHSIAKCHLSFSASSVSCLTSMIFFPLLLSIIDWRDEEWHMLKCISYLNFLPLRPSLAKIYQNNLQNEEVSEFFFFSGDRSFLLKTDKRTGAQWVIITTTYLKKYRKKNML